MGDTRFYFPSLQGLAQASEQTSSLFLKNYYLRLFFVAFIPRAVSFCFFSFSWDVFFFLLCSLLFRFRNHLFFFSKDLLMWQGELVYGLIRPGALEVLC